ncbi:deacetylase SIR2 [Aerococcus urinaehominis]|uniref:Deacetylase SIR2 n=1 Tax=Aerococcus urinaehominis TaxID=128944 RepID=A0A0X8FJT7_9LACT|nr:NAD-dependent deacetylase [Aerococcus urinaehominis]AMB98547.1 deacetylase SIR2 [Aerococcus urinaehominis]SDL78553.1 NAD-dependent protein deacetylase, SIR2 family [Aerococcus urinaehominis]
MTLKTWDTLKVDHLSQADQLAGLLKEAEAVVVGIGAGMSAADGFTYVGPRFRENFPDFIQKYRLIDMLQASLYDFDNIREYWAFQSRFVVLNYLDQPLGQSYLRLKEILADKAFHVITTNADNAFEKADYPENKVFHIQGKYCLWQCSNHCHNQTYRHDDAIRQMVAEQENMEIPAELVPYCPKCSAPMEINKRNEEKGMVEDVEFYLQKDHYDNFLDAHQHGRVLYLEIGVGHTTPQFIKDPFVNMTAANPEALFVTLNAKNYKLPDSVRPQTVWLNEDIADLIAAAHTQLVNQ